MKQDKLITIAAIVFAVIGLIELLTGKIVFGIAMLVAAMAAILFRGTGKFNDRSRYEKAVKTEGLKIEEVFEKIKGMDTAIGKPWMAEHEGYKGKSIVFGPDKYKDMVVISVDGKYFSIKHINKIANIKYSEADAWRFDDFLDTTSLEVNPANFSDFQAYKLVVAVMLIHLAEILEKLVNGDTSAVPEELDKFHLHYYNSGEGYFVDSDGEQYLEVEQNYNPFKARLLDLDGEEELRIEPRAIGKQGRVDDKAGYDMYFDGTHFADIERLTEGKKDCFVIRTEDMEFRAHNFPNVDRANIMYNYIISKDDKVMAIMGGNTGLKFEGLGMTENDVVLSLNEDYQKLYNAFWIFLMTLNKGLKER